MESTEFVYEGGGEEEPYKKIFEMNKNWKTIAAISVCQYIIMYQMTGEPRNFPNKGLNFNIYSQNI